MTRSDDERLTRYQRSTLINIAREAAMLLDHVVVPEDGASGVRDVIHNLISELVVLQSEMGELEGVVEITGMAGA